MRRISKILINSLLLVMFLSLLILPISSIGLTTFSVQNTNVLGSQTRSPSYNLKPSSPVKNTKTPFDSSRIFMRGKTVVEKSLIEVPNILPTSQSSQTTQEDK